MGGAVLGLGLILLLSAGCTGPAAHESADGGVPSPSAEPLGSIRGNVVDDEAFAVPGATVVVLDTDLVAQTDETGAFAFDRLDGSYTLIAHKRGYEDKAVNVDVATAEVSVTIRLSPLPSVAPYVEPFTFNGYITAGEASLDIVTGGLGFPGCDECTFAWNVTETVETAVVEIEFTPTVANPTGPTALGYQIWSTQKLNAGDLSGAYRTGEWASGGKVEIDGDEFPAGGEHITMTNYCSATWVCVDQHFTVYVNLFHHEAAPPDFSALPDA